MAHRLLMLCSAAALLSSCGEKRVVQMLPTPPERLICEKAQERPRIPPEYKIDWSKVGTVAQAKAEHGKYVASIRNREGLISGYIVALEGVYFTCWNNMVWRRDYEARLHQ